VHAIVQEVGNGYRWNHADGLVLCKHPSREGLEGKVAQREEDAT
jgi:hypothetical protein